MMSASDYWAKADNAFVLAERIAEPLVKANWEQVGRAWAALAVAAAAQPPLIRSEGSGSLVDLPRLNPKPHPATLARLAFPSETGRFVIPTTSPGIVEGLDRPLLVSTKQRPREA
jgi:hypothetical protein